MMIHWQRTYSFHHDSHFVSGFNIFAFCVFDVRLSDVIILSLQRFRYNWAIGDGIREKITDRFTFPMDLDFAQYLEQPVKPKT